MDDVELVWSNTGAEVHRLVVGPVANNVYVVRCSRTGEATLLDAANEPDRLLAAAAALGVTSVLTTHGHWDHIGAVEAFRKAGIPVWVNALDAPSLPGYDHVLSDDDAHVVGDLTLRAIHTPGHTPGSTCLALEGAPVLFTGDTLFPGGPGNATFEGGDFATIIDSIERRIFAAFDDDTVFFPGHGDSSTIGAERPHLAEWIERGW